MTREKLHEIKVRIKTDARTPSSWARMRGFPCVTVCNILNGYYNLKAPKAVEIFTALRADGYLVDEELAG